MGDELKETAAMGNVVGMLIPKVVHARDQFAAVASVRQSNLVGHPERG